MPKSAPTPVIGRDLVRLDNGVLVVGRCVGDLRQPYVSEPIPDYLSLVDHSLRIKRKKYENRLPDVEREFNELVRERLPKAGKFLVIALQGRDTAGKTGARVRLEAATDNDAKIFQAICIGPPTQDERAHPYLWRFLTGERMPRFGEIRVFDRSWAERLLVEPVMKLTPLADVQRAYAEIRAFEWLLQQQGAVLVKVWMDITKDEQARRFEDRAKDKPWKLSDADEVARKHWDDYTVAANEMFHRTGTEFAPWHIISSEDKRYSRVTILEVANKALREACGKSR